MDEQTLRTPGPDRGVALERQAMGPPPAMAVTTPLKFCTCTGVWRS